MSILAAVVGTLLSGVLAFIVATAKLSSDRKQWRMDAMVRGLGYLTGGTQNRSVGIGVISSLIATDNLPKNVRAAIDTILWTQLVHIAYHGENHKKTERENAKQLIKLVKLSEYESDPRLKEICSIVGYPDPVAPTPARGSQGAPDQPR